MGSDLMAAEAKKNEPKIDAAEVLEGILASRRARVDAPRTAAAQGLQRP